MPRECHTRTPKPYPIRVHDDRERGMEIGKTLLRALGHVRMLESYEEIHRGIRLVHGIDGRRQVGHEPRERRREEAADSRGETIGTGVGRRERLRYLGARAPRRAGEPLDERVVYVRGGLPGTGDEIAASLRRERVRMTRQDLHVELSAKIGHESV